MNPCIFSGTISITILSCFLIARQGFIQNQTESALLFTGAGLFITFAGYFLNLWTKKSRTLITILLLFVLVLLGKLVPNVPILAWIVAGSGGIMYLIALIKEYATKTNIAPTLKTMAVAVILGAYVGGLVFSSKYHDAYFLEKLTFGPPFDMGTDTLFHATLANMIANLGRITTGLDGVPFTAYHAGSHIIFAQLCKLLSQGCMPFFIFGYPLLVIPLFFNALCTLALQIIGLNQSEKEFDATNLYLAISCLTVGILPSQGKVCNLSGPFIGESYGFGLIVAFFAMGLVLEFFKKENEQKQPLIQKLLLFLVLIPALCAIMTACKFSTIYLFLAIAGYLFLRKKLFQDWVYACSLLISTLASYLVYKALSFPYQTHLDFFGYYKDMSVSSILLHAVFMYLPVWALLALRIRVAKTNNFLKILSEIAVVFAIICFAPSVATNLAGGATSYFLEPQYFVSSVLLVAFLTLIGTLSNKKVAYVLSAFLLIQTTFSVWKSTQKISDSKSALQSTEAPKERVLIMNKLQELSKLPLRERSHSIVFIPQSCKSYWDMSIPLATPFIEPAITGIAMLDGLPPVGFTGTIYYNYAPYSYGVRRIQIQDESVETLKRNAALWGFRNLIRLEGPDLSIKTENTSGI